MWSSARRKSGGPSAWPKSEPTAGWGDGVWQQPLLVVCPGRLRTSRFGSLRQRPSLVPMALDFPSFLPHSLSLFFSPVIKRLLKRHEKSSLELVNYSINSSCHRRGYSQQHCRIIRGRLSQTRRTPRGTSTLSRRFRSPAWEGAENVLLPRQRGARAKNREQTLHASFFPSLPTLQVGASNTWISTGFHAIVLVSTRTAGTG